MIVLKIVFPEPFGHRIAFHDCTQIYKSRRFIRKSISFLRSPCFHRLFCPLSPSPFPLSFHRPSPFPPLSFPLFLLFLLFLPLLLSFPQRALAFSFSSSFFSSFSVVS